MLMKSATIIQMSKVLALSKLFMSPKLTIIEKWKQNMMERYDKNPGNGKKYLKFIQKLGYIAFVISLRNIHVTLLDHKYGI